MQKGEKGVGLGMPHLNAIQVYCLIKHVLIQQIFISLTTANYMAITDKTTLHFVFHYNNANTIMNPKWTER